MRHSRIGHGRLPWTGRELSMFWGYTRLDWGKALSSNFLTHCAIGLRLLFPRFVRVTMMLPLWHSHFLRLRMEAPCLMTRNRPNPNPNPKRGRLLHRPVYNVMWLER